MSFFMSSEELLGTKLLEIVYILIGLITIYTGVKNVMDKKTHLELERVYFGLC